MIMDVLIAADDDDNDADADDDADDVDDADDADDVDDADDTDDDDNDADDNANDADAYNLSLCPPQACSTLFSSSDESRLQLAHRICLCWIFFIFFFNFVIKGHT